MIPHEHCLFTDLHDLSYVPFRYALARFDTLCRDTQHLYLYGSLAQPHTAFKYVTSATQILFFFLELHLLFEDSFLKPRNALSQEIVG
jgi:hypothetical protein